MHPLPHFQTYGVALLGLVEDDPADRSVLLQQELRRLAHGVSSSLTKMDGVRPTVYRVGACDARATRGRLGRASTGRAGALSSAATRASMDRWPGSPVRYPDPAVQVIDPSFAKYRLNLAAVERLATGF